MSPITELIGGAKAYGWGAVGAAIGDFESIATVTVPSGNTTTYTIVFTSIPQTYSHLQIRGIYRDIWAVSGTGEFYIKPNSSATSFNASFKWVLSGGTSGLSTYGYANRGDGIFMGQGVRNGSGANYYGGFVVDILEYTNTSKYKTFRGIGGADLNGSGTAVIQSGLYQSTSAISSLYIYPNGQGFAQYSKFALYGIKDPA
jgi:hypothetical protein